MFETAESIFGEGLEQHPSAVRFIHEVWFPSLAERGVILRDWVSQLDRCGQIKRAGCQHVGIS